eukprot:10340503-Lingulodinium_polyedra.AAC.1
MVRDRDLALLQAGKAFEMTQVERDRQTFLRDEQIKDLREQIHAISGTSRRDREGLERELER